MKEDADDGMAHLACQDDGSTGAKVTPANRSALEHRRVEPTEPVGICHDMRLWAAPHRAGVPGGRSGTK